MKTRNEKFPDPKELEKELGDFLTKKFGGSVKLATSIALPQTVLNPPEQPAKNAGGINFDLKPEDLVAYLDQYIIKQDEAKAILATKICTHFNRIKHLQDDPEVFNDMVGRIKNNVLMIGPTGVGKTYMVRLIAKKIGVPFVKGDATKFSETGYVGGDVEDLVRDLVREADGDIKKAQFGIIYIDEIDKIASSHNMIGADVSRTGVQRALLKPLEETEVDMKVPHDPISMLQELERYRKTGKRDHNSINTRNILFIVSGAFSELIPIIKKRISDQGIGFGAHITKSAEQSDWLKHVKSEDLIEYGFESEFVGRLPVRAVFERLGEADLFEILKNPNNPIILGKKLDFAAYGIKAKFDLEALRILAGRAYAENTGARGLVSSVETALLPFEKTLPSTKATFFPITAEVIDQPQKTLKAIAADPQDACLKETFEKLGGEERDLLRAYLFENRSKIAEKFNFSLTPSRIDLIARTYTDGEMDVERVIFRIKTHYEETKTLELHFLKNFGINLILEDDAIDYIIDQLVTHRISLDHYFKKLTADFEHGLKLVRDKTGRNRFFITQGALMDPERYISGLLKHAGEPRKAID
jgi:ATP-dependent Clp protease ATP-binding subunit ClpX